MKILTFILMAATALLAAEKSSSKAPADKPQASAAATPASVPAGAVQVEPNVYRFTDPQGKVWLYRKTPFGVSRWEDKPVPQPVIEEKNPTLVKDLGDTVQFERQTPFGVSKWVRKKSDLSEDEKALLVRQQRAVDHEGK